jgi:probable phosphoglycerate mutase
VSGGCVRVRHDVFFVRHGETDWNVERRHQGHSDTALNDNRRAQAARNGAALRPVLERTKGVLYVSSPLIRATETIEILRDAIGLPRRRYAIDRPTVIVGHGASGRILRGYLLGLAPRRGPHLSAPQDRVFRISRGREDAH